MECRRTGREISCSTTQDGAKSWALTHRSDLLAVLTFVAHIQDMQMEMLRMMHMLVASGAVASRQGAALLGVALACNLDTTAVERRLLPALTRLTEDRSRQVIGTLGVLSACLEVLGLKLMIVVMQGATRGRQCCERGVAPSLPRGPRALCQSPDASRQPDHGRWASARGPDGHALLLGRGKTPPGVHQQLESSMAVTGIAARRLQTIDSGSGRNEALADASSRREQIEVQSLGKATKQKFAHCSDGATGPVIFGAQGAPCSSPEQLEFMLQKVLWLLAYIAQRNTCGKPPTHLAETATVVFDCLRAVDNLDAQLRHHHNVQLHMVSALTCLRREAELLDSSRRETLFAMCRDHDATTPAMGTPGDARPGLPIIPACPFRGVH